MAMSSAVTKIETRRMDNKKRLASDGTVRLEAESQGMEERLSVLRKIMSAEKSRREEAGGIHWQKGQKGPLHRRQALPPRAPPPGPSRGPKGGEGASKKPLRIRILTDRNKGAKGSSKLPSCGQCDKSTASLSCLECVENYCTVCFAKFHQKGALSRHHVKPMMNKPPVNPAAHNGVSAGTNNSTGSGRATLPKTTSILSGAKGNSTSMSTAADSQAASTAIATNCITTMSHSSSHGGIGGGGSLLEGTYDEAEAAASFQEALAEWRTGGGAHETGGRVRRTSEKGENTVTMRDSSCSTQSTQSTPATTTDPRSLRVEFSSKTGVSYFERLMVRRHRVETVFGKAREASKGTGCLNVAPKLSLESETDREESALESVPSQYNLFYSTEDVEGEVCEMSSPTEFQFERPSSSVRIEEMGFTMEETEPKVKASMPEHTKSKSKPAVTNSKALPKELDSRRKKPHSAKRQVVAKRSSSTAKVSDAVPTQKPTPSISRGGQMTAETDIATSVRSAWADSDRRPHRSEPTILSTFFLSGVQRSDQTPTTSPKSDEAISQAHSEGRFRFASTVWLPGSSSVAMYSNQKESLSPQPMAPVHTPDNHYRNKERDSDFDINTDLPPPTITSPAASDIDGSRIPTRQTTASTCNYYYDSDSSSSESCDNLSLYDIEGAEFEKLQQLQDWEERADSEALESLTSELGRITRCQGEVEEERGKGDCHFGGLVQDHREAADVSQEMCGGDETTVGGHSVDVERVMSEFEMYHQQLMEDSDQD